LEGALRCASKGVGEEVDDELNPHPLATIYSSTETQVLPRRLRGCFMVLLKPSTPENTGHDTQYSSTPTTGRRRCIINE